MDEPKSSIREMLRGFTDAGGCLANELAARCPPGLMDRKIPKGAANLAYAIAHDEIGKLRARERVRVSPIAIGLIVALAAGNYSDG